MLTLPHAMVLLVKWPLVPPFAQTPLSPSFLPTTRLIFNPDPSLQYEGYFAGQASSLRVKKKACSHFAPSLNGGPWLAAFIETPPLLPFNGKFQQSKAEEE